MFGHNRRVDTPKGELTRREREVLGAIRVYVAEKGCPPTVREIAQATGIRSPATVHGYLKVLEIKGLLKTAPRRSRGISLPRKEEAPPPIPLYDRMDFAARSAVVKGSGEHVHWRELLSGEGLFAVRAAGREMEPEIKDGDLAVVRPQPAVMAGSMVAVQLDGGFAIRWLSEKGRALYLKTADPRRPLIPLGKREVLGKVICVLRSYR